MKARLAKGQNQQKSAILAFFVPFLDIRAFSYSLMSCAVMMILEFHHFISILAESRMASIIRTWNMSHRPRLPPREIPCLVPWSWSSLIPARPTALYAITLSAGRHGMHRTGVLYHRSPSYPHRRCLRFPSGPSERNGSFQALRDVSAPPRLMGAPFLWCRKPVPTARACASLPLPREWSSFEVARECGAKSCTNDEGSVGSHCRVGIGRLC